MLNPVLRFSQLMAFLILTLTGTTVLSSGENRYGPVRNNENLWNIAVQVKPDDNLTTIQVAMSIFQRNPQAFRYNNLNGLMQNKILIIPSATDMHSVSKQTAEKMFSLHWDKWKNRSSGAELKQNVSEVQLTENLPNTVSKDKALSSNEKNLKHEPTQTTLVSQSQDDTSNVKPKTVEAKTTEPKANSMLEPVEKIVEKKHVVKSIENSTVLLPENNGSVFQSKKLVPAFETDNKESTLQKKNLRTLVSIQEKASIQNIASMQNKEAMPLEQSKKSNEAPKIIPEYLVASESENVIALFLSQLQARIKTYFVNNRLSNKYLLSIAGFLGMLLVFNLLFRKEQTYPTVKLLDDTLGKDKDDVSEKDEILEKSEKEFVVVVDSNTNEFDFAITMGVAEENDPLDYIEKLQAKLKKSQQNEHQQQSDFFERNSLNEQPSADLKFSEKEYSPKQLITENDEIIRQSHIKNFIMEFSDINNKLSEAYIVIETNADNKNSLRQFLVYLKQIKQLSFAVHEKFIYHYTSALVELLQCQLNSGKSMNKQIVDILSQMIFCNKEIISSLIEKRSPSLRVTELTEKAEIIRQENCPQSDEEYIYEMVDKFLIEH
jgi:FimV-like protein